GDDGEGAGLPRTPAVPDRLRSIGTRAIKNRGPVYMPSEGDLAPGPGPQARSPHVHRTGIITDLEPEVPGSPGGERRPDPSAVSIGPKIQWQDGGRGVKRFHHAPGEHRHSARSWPRPAARPR